MMMSSANPNRMSKETQYEMLETLKIYLGLTQSADHL
jgi:hypothetical protein